MTNMTVYKGFAIVEINPGELSEFKAYRNSHYFDSDLCAYSSTSLEIVRALIDSAGDHGEFIEGQQVGLIRYYFSEKGLSACKEIASSYERVIRMFDLRYKGMPLEFMSNPKLELREDIGQSLVEDQLFTLNIDDTYSPTDEGGILFTLYTLLVDTSPFPDSPESSLSLSEIVQSFPGFLSASSSMATKMDVGMLIGLGYLKEVKSS